MQSDAFADVVVLTVKAALAPVLERLAAAEQANRELRDRLQDVSSLRDRLVAVETKSGQPPVADPAVMELRDRVAAIEYKAAQPAQVDPGLSELRDRLVAVETKSIPEVHPVDLTPIMERLAASDARLARLAALELTVGELRDRLVALDAKSTMPVPAALEAVQGPNVADLELAFTKQIAALSERVAVAEVRQPVPGPAGKDGQNGADGKPGADGLGFEDLDVEFDGDRTLTLKFARGSQVKSWPIKFPFLRHQGVFIEGKSYDVGDVVTWGGSMWHAGAETTAKPGEGSRDWTLVVKRGRDGKDGRDGQAVPVVSVGRPS